MSTPCLISVDWDFFVYTGVLQGPFKGTNQITGEPIQIPGLFLFDWGHSEHQAPGLQGILWSTRYATFESHGIPFEETVKLMQSPEQFSTAVRDKLNVRLEAPLAVADSHALIWPAVRDMAETHGPLHVVSFDAHSDLGYGAKPSSKVACDNWLLNGLAEGYIKSAIIVYPDWRGDEEWDDHDDEIAAQYNVQHMTWSDWRAHEDGDLNVVMSFACRSSAWTPPHLDSEWVKFIDSWDTTYQLCIECHLAPGTAGEGPHHGCTPREWNMEHVKLERAFIAEAVERERERRAQ